ncbi:hypothetical protein [Mycolicibacterium frederiksbergense]|uniref:hypothetical protein n=1 Tax=Mycolicibacterium frederiksbergense TaxID=117567 RepID=UPI002476D21F|nr:hypothetical protein [Mycolicibacterium frederiksbergense]
MHLTAAIDNPIDVFAPVLDKARTVIETNIQNELAHPFPIANAIVAKALADGQTLGDIANTMAPVVANLVKYFPVSTDVALKKLAAGNLVGALDTYVGLFFGPVWVGFMQYGRLVGLVEDKFEIGKRLASAAMYYGWSATIGIAYAGFGLARTTAWSIQELGKAIGTGDPANVVNAVQHGIANIASTAITQADLLKFVLDPRPAIANAINPPPPDPEEEFRTAKTVPNSTTPSLPATSTSTVEAPSIAAPQAEPKTDAVTETGAPAEVAPKDETPTSETKPLVRDSLVAAPGKPGVTSARNDIKNKLASTVSDQVSATVNKIGEGIKSALAKPEKKSTTASAGADKEGGAAGDTK